jgi:hypothetical protein
VIGPQHFPKAIDQQIYRTDRVAEELPHQSEIENISTQDPSVSSVTVPRNQTEIITRATSDYFRITILLID